MRPLFRSTFVTVLSLILLSTPSVLFAEATAPKVQKLPFHGKLAAVDTTAETITLSGKSARVFHLTATTKITDGAGSPATLAEATVGEDVGGSYAKDTAGTLTLFSVRFGAKAKAGAPAATPTAAEPSSPPSAPSKPSAPAPAPAAEPAPAPAAAPAPSAPAAAAMTKAKKQTFSGKVVSVDSAAGTMVVHGRGDQTFTITSTTKIVDATGGALTLAAVTAGSKVSGSYSKSEDGTVLTVYTLKVK